MKLQINNLKQTVQKITTSNENLTKKLSGKEESSQLKQQIQTLNEHQEVLRLTIQSNEETMKALTAENSKLKLERDCHVKLAKQ